MDEHRPALIIASGSPRRIELLGRLVTSFESLASPVEDTGAIDQPEISPPALTLPAEFAILNDDHPTFWAWHKAVEVAGRLPASRLGAFVLGADTVVIGPGRIFGKPTTPSAAEEMLRALRGKKHYVATGFALVASRSGGNLISLSDGVTVSAVCMRDFADDELKGYVATGEPLDKAGAYAVQGLGGRLVERVDGCYLNVVGLPLCRVREALKREGIRVSPMPEDGYCGYCRKLVDERAKDFVAE